MVAEQVREIVAQRKVIYEKQEISFTVSIGVAAIRGDTNDINDIEDILKMADDALYKAKAKGRNCVVTWESLDGTRGQSPCHIFKAKRLADMT